MANDRTPAFRKCFLTGEHIVKGWEGPHSTTTVIPGACAFRFGAISGPTDSEQSLTGVSHLPLITSHQDLLCVFMSLFSHRNTEASFPCLLSLPHQSPLHYVQNKVNLSAASVVNLILRQSINRLPHFLICVRSQHVVDSPGEVINTISFNLMPSK